jgi:hypothetical protein
VFALKAELTPKAKREVEAFLAGTPYKEPELRETPEGVELAYKVEEPGETYWVVEGYPERRFATEAEARAFAELVSGPRAELAADLGGREGAIPLAPGIFKTIEDTVFDPDAPILGYVEIPRKPLAVHPLGAYPAPFTTYREARPFTSVFETPTGETMVEPDVFAEPPSLPKSLTEQRLEKLFALEKMLGELEGPPEEFAALGAYAIGVPPTKEEFEAVTGYRPEREAAQLLGRSIIEYEKAFAAPVYGITENIVRTVEDIHGAVTGRELFPIPYAVRVKAAPEEFLSLEARAVTGRISKKELEAVAAYRPEFRFEVVPELEKPYTPKPYAPTAFQAVLTSVLETGKPLAEPPPEALPGLGRLAVGVPPTEKELEAITGYRPTVRPVLSKEMRRLLKPEMRGYALGSLLYEAALWYGISKPLEKGLRLTSKGIGKIVEYYRAPFRPRVPPTTRYVERVPGALVKRVGYPKRTQKTFREIPYTRLGVEDLKVVPPEGYRPPLASHLRVIEVTAKRQAKLPEYFVITAKDVTDVIPSKEAVSLFPKILGKTRRIQVPPTQATEFIFRIKKGRIRLVAEVPSTMRGVPIAMRPWKRVGGLQETLGPKFRWTPVKPRAREILKIEEEFTKEVGYKPRTPIPPSRQTFLAPPPPGRPYEAIPAPPPSVMEKAVEAVDPFARWSPILAAQAYLQPRVTYPKGTDMWARLEGRFKLPPEYRTPTKLGVAPTRKPKFKPYPKPYPAILRMRKRGKLFERGTVGFNVDVDRALRPLTKITRQPARKPKEAPAADIAQEIFPRMRERPTVGVTPTPRFKVAPGQRVGVMPRQLLRQVAETVQMQVERPWERRRIRRPPPLFLFPPRRGKTKKTLLPEWRYKEYRHYIGDPFQGMRGPLKNLNAFLAGKKPAKKKGKRKKRRKR